MPMAAYERALLLITQHTDRVSQDPNRSGDYELLLEVPKKCWIQCHTRQMFNLSNNSKIHYIVHQQHQYSEWIITTHPSIPMWKAERFVYSLLTILKFNFRQERNLPQQKGSSRITISCGDSWDVYMLHVEPYSVSWAKRSVALLIYSRFLHFLLDLFFILCWSKFSINSHASPWNAFGAQFEPLIHPVFWNCATWMYIWCAFFGRQS